jgi:hypothetical protein
MPIAAHVDSAASRGWIAVPALTIAAAITGIVIGAAVTLLAGAKYLACQAVFTYGSGGTTAKFWVQTTLDGGTTWIDVMSFAFTTATATKVSAVVTSTALAAGITPGSAGLADNTILSGLLGDQVRVIGTTTGTYAGGTTIAIGAVTKG